MAPQLSRPGPLFNQRFINESREPNVNMCHQTPSKITLIIGKDATAMALQLSGEIQHGAAIRSHPVNQNERLTLPRFPIGDAEFRARLSENPMT